MSLFKLTSDKMEPVSRTTFEAEQILERNDIQRMLREDISPLGSDLLVIAEEYGEWQGVNRRIDLLCLNQNGDVVVVEIKRTEDGGHMELQALRYAAMVSSMTLDQAVHTYARFLNAEEEQARKDILDFLQSDATTEDIELTGEVRIMLVSADFSTEIASTVLWLNRRDLDITCVRLRPYKIDGEILVDVTQIIPLPEASDYEVKLRTQEREQKRASGRWQAELQRFWIRFIEHYQGAYQSLAGRSAPKIQKFILKRGEGYSLRMYVLKNESDFGCTILLPEEEDRRADMVARLIEKRPAVEAAFGEELNWKDYSDRQKFVVSQSIDGGWASPESDWPGIQRQLFEKTLKLEQSLHPVIEDLKKNG